MTSTPVPSHLPSLWVKLIDMKHLVFESYGNNEIRIGWNDLPCRLRGGGDGEAQRVTDRQAYRMDAAREQMLSDNKLFQYRDTNGTLYRGNTESGYSEVEVSQSQLDIIRESQQANKASGRTPRHSYGQPVRKTVFTRNARHRLLEAGCLFDSVHSATHRGYFVTLTLPGSTDEAYDAISRWSGYLVNRILQVVRREIQSALWFYVWELQKRGALHLHLFIALPKEVDGAYILRGLRAVWYGALVSVGEKDGTDMFRHRKGDYCTASEFWQFDVQEVEKSPAAYISKYVSKSANAPTESDSADMGRYSYYPARWWGMSQAFRELIKEHRFRVCMDAMSDDEIIAEMDCMDAVLQECVPVCEHEYIADIGSNRDNGGIIGRIYRRVYYFAASDFPIVTAMFRAAVGKLKDRMARHLVSWQYHSDQYQGIPIGAL